MSIDFTTSYNKLNLDLMNYAVNHSIRYDFQYNGYDCRIYYTHENNLQNVLTLIVDINNVLYPFVIHAINMGTITEYIAPEIYQHIKPVFAPDKYTPHPFFEHICETIQNRNPIYEHFDSHEPRLYHYQNNIHKPYFECFVRQNMSPEMKKRLKNTYPYEFYKDLYQFCREHRITTRFNIDPARAHDIVIEMQNYV